ncbi:MAG: SGNH/GDSL hydrolase family protein [Bacteroidetes bacterium]|nr:SGNH/GDSL hydrolase family protein [Bacteroidota bacterium]
MIFFHTLIIFTIYSFALVPIKLFNIEIKQSGIKEFISPSMLPQGKLLINSRKSSYVQHSPVDSTAQRFLLIGDSMLEGLGYRLNDYCKKNGHKMNSVIWYSSSTLWYGSCDTIAYFIKKFDPTYIVLVIGSNELFIRDIIRNRDKFVKNILRQMGDKKFIWVGPPNWKKDSGINDLIARNTGEKKYFPSKNLTFNRNSDGAHPTRQSASMWMDSIASFIMKKSMYPVILNYPDEAAKKSPPTTLLGPKPPKGI